LIYALKKIFSIKKNTFLLRKYSLILIYKKKKEPARNCRFFFAINNSIALSTQRMLVCKNENYF